MNCPKCGSKMRLETAPYTYEDCCYIGDFEAYVCQKCNSSYFTEKGMKDALVEAHKKLDIICTNSTITYSTMVGCCVLWQHMEPLQYQLSSIAKQGVIGNDTR